MDEWIPGSFDAAGQPAPPCAGSSRLTPSKTMVLILDINTAIGVQT